MPIEIDAIQNGKAIGWSDARIARDAAETLAQRRGANAQTFRLYNTFTDASNFERGFMRWSSNVLEIGTEAGGTGTARALTVSNLSSLNFPFAAEGNVARIFVNGTVGLDIFNSRTAGTGNVRVNSATGNVIVATGLSANPRLTVFSSGSATKSLGDSGLQSRNLADSDFAPLQGRLRAHANAVSETITPTHTLRLFDAAGVEYRVPAIAV